MKRLTHIFYALLGVAALILTTLAAAGRLACRTLRKGWRNRPKWLRRTIKAAVAVGIVWMIYTIGHAYYKNNYGRIGWHDTILSETVESHHFRDGSERIYNTLTEQYTTGRINWISEVSKTDSIVVYALPHRRGYICARTGEILIDAEQNRYTKAWIFSEGLAAVKKEGRIGFINRQNEFVIPLHFHDAYLADWDDAYNVFHNGRCIVGDENGLLGVIDTAGRWVIEPRYTQIARSAANDWFVVSDDYLDGVVDAAGKELYPTSYDTIAITEEGITLTREGRMWQEDFTGKVIRRDLFDASSWLNYADGYNEEGALAYTLSNYMKYRIGGYYGLLDRRTGELITPAIYEDINALSPTLVELQDPDTYDWFTLCVE